MTETPNTIFLDPQGNAKNVPELMELGNRLVTLGQEFTKEAKGIAEGYGIGLDVRIRFEFQQPVQGE